MDMYFDAEHIVQSWAGGSGPRLSFEFALLQRNRASTSAAKDALVVRQAPVSRVPIFQGSPRGMRGFGWWERRWARPQTHGAHHDHN